jgi:hypothetical protein
VQQYNYKGSNDNSIGVIAQDLEDILPSAIKTNADGILSVEYQQLAMVNLKATQELDANKADKKDVEDLQNKVEKLSIQPPPRTKNIAEYVTFTG